MPKPTLRVAIALVTPLLIVAATSAQPSFIKWHQPPVWTTPDNFYDGWNEISLYGGPQIAADDWVCDANRPVTTIRWWGSYVDWNRPVPPEPQAQSFVITFWTDVPAGFDAPYSHPGDVIWQYEAQVFTEELYGWDVDPRENRIEACFEYEVQLPNEAWFFQESGQNIYWISIAAVQVVDCPCFPDMSGGPDTNYLCDGVIDFWDLEGFNVAMQDRDLYEANYPGCDWNAGDLDCDGDIDDDDSNIFVAVLAGGGCPAVDVPYQWGWKTRPRRADSTAPDAAVRIFDPTAPFLGAAYAQGQPLTWPDDNAQWDLAFELISDAPSQNYKWLQEPVIQPGGPCFLGWDEYSVYGDFQIGAADWLCETDEPVADVHWWGSYIGWDDLVPPLGSDPAFWVITIWDAHPLAPGFPDLAVWQWVVDPLDVTVTYAGCDEYPPMSFGESTFYYTFDVPESEWYFQPPGGPHELWVSISPIYFIPPQYPWGWTTRPEVDPPNYPGVRIYDPTAPLVGSSVAFADYLLVDNMYWDYAFGLTTPGQSEPMVKWSQPPEPYLNPVIAGYDERSNFGHTQIVADDWLCNSAYHVGFISWWGSFEGWSQTVPPPEGVNRPSGFHFCVWSEDPNDPGHPYEVVWESCTRELDWSSEVMFASWDADLCNPQRPPEAVFRFDHELAGWDWFVQRLGENMYWFTVSANYCAPNNDMDHDGMLSITDQLAFLNCLNDCPLHDCAGADLDCDGDIDTQDELIFLQLYYEGVILTPPPPPDIRWGWTTRRDPAGINFQPGYDIWNPTAPQIGDVFTSGAPVGCPAQVVPQELAFQLNWDYPCADANCDGLINFGDIDPFVLAITNYAQYQAEFPGCDNADTNFDSLVNFGDIDPFVYAITHDQCPPPPN